MNENCANCNKSLGRCTGESGIYSPEIGFTLCEDCFHEEYAAIEERGSNNWPERLKHYKQNQPGHIK